MDKPKKGKKLGTIDMVLLFIAIYLVIFIERMIWIFAATGAVPDTLISCVLTAALGECGITGAITAVNKWIRNKEKQDAPMETEDASQI